MTCTKQNVIEQKRLMLLFNSLFSLPGQTLLNLKKKMKIKLTSLKEHMKVGCRMWVCVWFRLWDLAELVHKLILFLSNCMILDTLLNLSVSLSFFICKMKVIITLWGCYVDGLKYVYCHGIVCGIYNKPSINGSFVISLHIIRISFSL